MTEGEAPTPPRRPVASRSEETEARPPPHRPSLGRPAVGLILLGIGLGWLLQSLGVVAFPWDALLPVALIAVGAALVVGSRTGRHSGLIVLGIVLTLTTALMSASDVPLVGGIGQRVNRPQSIAEVQPRHDLAIGQLVIDLSGLSFTESERVEMRARVGMGELVVELPQWVVVEARARAGLGDVQVFGRQSSGLGAERRIESQGGDPGDSKLVLDLSVGLGSVKVNG